jgi:hypothetical protein
MRKLMLFLVLIAVNDSFAQRFLPQQHDTLVHGHELIVQGHYDLSSSSLSRELIQKFVSGGEITNAMSDFAFNRHNGINRVGVELSGEVEYRNTDIKFFGKEQYGFVVKGGYTAIGSLLYSKDLFGLVFNGNESYLGAEASLSGSTGSFWAFQKFGIGAIDQKTKSNISLNLYGISSFVTAKMREGTFYQTENADSLSLTLDGGYAASTGANYFKGVGIGIDLDYRMPVEIVKGKTAYIQFLVKNLGAAYLSSPVTSYSANTQLSFNGLTFDQLYGTGSVFNGSFSLSDTLHVDSTSGSGWKMMPAVIQVGKMISEMEDAMVQGFYGIRMYPTLSAVPMVYAGAQIKVNTVSFGVNVSYGGFTGFRAGYYSQFNFKKFNIGLGLEDVYGTLSKKGYGDSFIFRFRCAL